MIEILAGAVVGALTIGFAKLIKGERWVYSLGLLTLPGFYAFLAFQAGDHAAAVKEMVFGAPYVVAGLVCVFVSFRLSAVLVGALWLLHGGYDLVHGHLLTNSGVPRWYPVYCMAVDVVVGGYLLWLSRRLPNADIRLA